MPSRTPTPTPTVTDTPNAALTAAVAYLQALATATAVGVAPEDTRFDGVDGALYVRVPAGEFRMGSSSSDSEAVNDEKPQHVVYLDEFWIMQTETTSAQYQQCVDAGRCRALSCSGAARGDHPVMCVSWQDATDYCAWGGGRLPTEAEWEKAARGTDGRKYPWGNDAPTDRRLNYNMNIRDTTPVGSYPTGASPYGALDMAGNVWEWVADWYEEKYYASSPARNPQGPASGQYRVLRGGSWYNAQQNVHAAYRNRGVPEFRLDALGFRCARSP
jgi:formylglycine-generating enzyme required for sulfatase activity